MQKMTALRYCEFGNTILSKLSETNGGEQVELMTTATRELLGRKNASASAGEGEGGSKKTSPKSKWKAKEASSKKHACAEQKRRERINRHYTSLRHFFPSLSKKDKASVLTETVRRVKELRRMVTEECGTGGEWPLYLPSDHDEANVSPYDGSTEGKMVKATICCEDRPGVNRDLAEAVKLVRGKAVKAEMVTIGGRMKAVVVVQLREGGGGEEDVGSLRRALKAVVENRAYGPSRLVAHSWLSGKWAVLGHS